CGVLNGQVQPGDTVAIVGAGPVGLAALLTAQFYSPAEIVMIDLDDNRLEVARKFGATRTINSGKEDVKKTILQMTGDIGVDTVTTPMLLKTIQSKKLDAGKLITHRFKLHDILKAYDTFQHAGEEKSLKVILSNG